MAFCEMQGCTNGMPELELSPDVHVWFASPLEIVERSLLEKYRRLLTNDERAQEKRFHFARDQHTYLVTRALVRTVLSKYVAVAPDQWRFLRDAYGRPRIANFTHNRNMTFNVTHTGGLIGLAVVGEAALGIDAEDMRGNPIQMDVADRFFTKTELQQMRCLESHEQEERFYAVWTLKEAYIKARGLGLSIPLDSFSFDFSRSGIARMEMSEMLEDTASRWQFWQWRPTSHHVAAICASKRTGIDRKLICRFITPSEREEMVEPMILRNSG